MNNLNVPLIRAAEKEIAMLLAKLEKDADALVEAIAVIDVDVTTAGDVRKQLLRRVLIDMRRIPGAEWG